MVLLDFLLAREPSPGWMDILRPAVVSALRLTRGRERLVAYRSDLPTCRELRELVPLFFGRVRVARARANAEN